MVPLFALSSSRSSCFLTASLGYFFKNSDKFVSLAIILSDILRKRIEKEMSFIIQQFLTAERETEREL